MQNAKALIQSKTFWVAVAQAILGALVVFGSTYPTVGWIVMAKSVLDVVIRLYTTQPITSVTTS